MVPNMKTWFIRLNHQSFGPYTIEELKTLPVAEDDYIWKKGLPDWVQAGSIPELRRLFTTTPVKPMETQNKMQSNASLRHQSMTSPTNSTAVKRNNSRQRLLWISIVLVLSLVTYLVYANKQSTSVFPFSQKSPEQQRAELAQVEQQDPVKYISDRVGNRQNLIGQTVVEGTLTNSATAAVFKDVVLKVDFISKTNSVISSQKYTIYQVLNPGQTVSFKEKAFAGKDVNNVNVSILGASPVN
jgi:hypothetical protein